MHKLRFAIFILLAPLLCVASRQAAVLLLSNSDAGGRLERGGGSLVPKFFPKLDAYRSTLLWAAIFGGFVALLPASEFARLLKGRHDSQPEDRPSV